MRYSHWPLLEPGNLILIGHLQAGDEVGVTGKAWMKRQAPRLILSLYTSTVFCLHICPPHEIGGTLRAGGFLFQKSINV